MRSKATTWLIIYTAIVVTLILGWVTMGHGTPDWWGSEPGETTFQVQDVGELAARLGSIDTWDRRGNVIWLTSFENGLAGFGGDGEGPEGSGLRLSAKAPYSGAYHLDNYSGAGNTGAACSKVLPFAVPSGIGFEGVFSYPAELTQFVWRLDTYDGSLRTRFALRYTPATTTLEVQTGATTWTLLSNNVQIQAGLGYYNHIKLVGDLTTGKYSYAIVNDYPFDLSAYDGVAEAAAVAPKLNPYVISTFSPAGGYSVYIDDVIITQNEP
jgi:hypothetical protein